MRKCFNGTFPKYTIAPIRGNGFAALYPQYGLVIKRRARVFSETIRKEIAGRLREIRVRTVPFYRCRLKVRFTVATMGIGSPFWNVFAV
jgi:hypothetical protein